MAEWEVRLADEFIPEYRAFPLEVRDELEAHLIMLRIAGPTLGRPLVDTLHGSEHANMKELRFNADGGVWRAAFTFDPNRRAIVLVAGNKKGKNSKAFYTRLIRKADIRFDAHVSRLEKKNE